MTTPEVEHEHWMARALQLAHKGYNTTHPNPRVGCIIVSDGGQIAAGFHEYAGGPHAEINALSQCGGDAKKGTVYVTLEPCSHTGKTPPCTEALIRARPERVVIAMQDPNPQVAGSGIEALKQAGIDVVCNVLKSQALALNAGFIKRMTQHRPFVRIKMAMSMDGRTALSNGLSEWITGMDARQDVQLLRAGSSAILSSAATVLSDDASLNVRLTADQLQQQTAVRQPIRIIIDSQLRLTGREKLFAIEGEIWIFTTRQDDHWTSRFNRNTKLFVMPEQQDGHMDLALLMKKLADLEINEVHTECGARLSGALLKQSMVDELVLYMAPNLLGDRAKGLFDLGEISIMSDKIKLSIQDVRSIGSDIKIIAKTEPTCLR